MCSCDDGEPCTLSKSADVKARKEHKCGECLGPIAKGETYRHTRFLFEGEWDQHKVCAGCVLRIKAYQSVEGCWPLMGGLFDAIEECGQEDPDFDEQYEAKCKELGVAA